jgi:hypothetical protein
LKPDPDPHNFLAGDPDPPIKFRSGSAGPLLILSLFAPPLGKTSTSCFPICGVDPDR